MFHCAVLAGVNQQASKQFPGTVVWESTEAIQLSMGRLDMATLF